MTDPYRPTQQFPMPPPPEPTFWQRYRAAMLAAAAVVVLVVVGVVLALASSPSSSAAPPPSSPPSSSAAPPPSSPPSSPPPASPSASPAPSSGAPDGKHVAVTRGTVVGEAGDTWTIKTARGDTVTVTITGATKFGTEKQPVDKSAITVNSKVIVTGKNSGGRIDARRIRQAKG